MKTVNISKILTVVGARPQFIKAAVVSSELKKIKTIDEIIVHTGQHYNKEMSDIFFEELELSPPMFNLGIGSLSQGTQVGRMLESLELIMKEQKPDLVLTYGDTNSTLAGALAASKLHIAVAHVEAGLRSFNKKMPEEINRILTDHMSDILFAPTQKAIDNLYNEGITSNSYLVGDVMLDAIFTYTKISDTKSHLLKSIKRKHKDFILLTIHRPENTDNLNRLYNIIITLANLSKKYDIIFPIHPRTEAVFKKHQKLFKIVSLLCIIQPVGYLDMISLTKNALVVVTDSGGLQKEAFFLKTPCVTLRDQTEWNEIVELGGNVVVSPVDADIIQENIIRQISQSVPKIQPYGDGTAGTQILNILMKYFS